ncbi:MAG: hypothetical protein U9R08_03145 [Nanoarchaeota archaeon]|nr:hypothetical protein [Nanoarchaeota archaeon]
MNQPLLVTAAIIEKNQKLLLIKRAREPFKDYWCFIGGCGAFKTTSNPIEAVKIEVLADINCNFKPNFFRYNQDKFEVPTITLFFYGSIEKTPVITPKYVSEYRWFDKKDILKLNLGFDHKLILNEYLKRFPSE